MAQGPQGRPVVRLEATPGIASCMLRILLHASGLRRATVLHDAPTNSTAQCRAVRRPPVVHKYRPVPYSTDQSRPGACSASCDTGPCCMMRGGAIAATGGLPPPIVYVEPCTTQSASVGCAAARTTLQPGTRRCNVRRTGVSCHSSCCIPLRRAL